jgi:hypothetical protein
MILAAQFLSYVTALVALFLLGVLFGRLLSLWAARRSLDDAGDVPESWWARHNRLWRERRAARREERRLRDVEPWEFYEERTREGWRREAEQQASSPTVVRPAGGGLVRRCSSRPPPARATTTDPCAPACVRIDRRPTWPRVARPAERPAGRSDRPAVGPRTSERQAAVGRRREQDGAGQGQADAVDGAEVLGSPDQAPSDARAAMIAEDEARRRRVEEIAAQAAEQRLPHGSVERAVATGLRDPSVDVEDPTSVYANDPHLADVVDEETAVAAARRLGRQVPVPGEPGVYARPNGQKGPYQPL